MAERGPRNVTDRVVTLTDRGRYVAERWDDGLVTVSNIREVYSGNSRAEGVLNLSQRAEYEREGEAVLMGTGIVVLGGSVIEIAKGARNKNALDVLVGTLGLGIGTATLYISRLYHDKAVDCGHMARAIGRLKKDVKQTPQGLPPQSR